jgi:hypothetical protein
MKKMRYIYSMEFYLDSKRNEVMLFPGKWIILDIINLYEISQSYKSIIIHFLSFVEAREKK